MRAELDSVEDDSLVARALKEVGGTAATVELAACTRAALLGPDARALQKELDRDEAQVIASRNLLRKKRAPFCSEEGLECPADAFPCCTSGSCGASVADCRHGFDFRKKFGGAARFQKLHQYRVFRQLCANVPGALESDAIEEIMEAGGQVFGSVSKLREALDSAVMYNITVVGQMVRVMYLKHDVDNGNMMVTDRRGDAYKLKSLELSPGDVAIDVGGRLSFVALILAKVYGVRVYAMEASPISYFHLLLNLRLNGVTSPRVELYYGLLSGKDGPMVNVPVYTGAAEPKIKVPTVSLDRIIRENDLGDVKLLKLNCSPCEYEIVPQISSIGLADKFKYVVY